MARDKSIIKKHAKIADRILALEPEISKLTDEQLKNKTTEFRDSLNSGSTLDDILVESFAVVREAAKRTLGLNAYRVQLIGGIILHKGDIAEMKTGEGKTLTGLFPAYLNALSGNGVHIVTVNEYLSQRDSEINGKVYDFLGITVGLNGRDLSKHAKRNAYAQDVTYTTNAELGFDYLRDNMVYDLKEKVQRGLNYAIIDEADSVLIDEARTPLIISGGTQNRINMYKAAASFAEITKEKTHVDIDLETKQVFLTDEGIVEAQNYFSVTNLFDVANTELFHLIMNALKAKFTFKEGIEYTVQDGEIVLIDQFTGRIMQGRSYSDGLQQALQAKEHVEIEEETATLATITYQNFYRLYNKLSGMTGTAKTEEEEFIKIYNTRVIVCPTNKPIIRKDEPDFTLATKNAALKKMVKDIKEIHEIGRPILIGTTSVESSEQVARYLKNADLKFEMINAKNHYREAEIVEKAGQTKAITLATNMAGRGTDIKLSKEAREAGGLFVFGVERNEARRIDNQLRGRAGRQGDNGSSRFYISMEDDLMIRFTSPKLRQMFLKLGDDHIKSRMFTKAVTNAQKRLEGLNFDQRKNVLDYDNVLSQHRESMYAQRDDILSTENLKIVLSKFQYTLAFEFISEFSEVVRGEQTVNVPNLIKSLEEKYIIKNSIDKKDLMGKEKKDIAKIIQDKMMEYYISKMSDIPENVVYDIEKRTILQAFDKYWTRHINLAQKLRSGVYLQQYAQNNPLHLYIEESAKLYNRMKIDIAKDTIDNLLIITIKEVDEKTNTPIKEKKTEQIEIKDEDIDLIFKEIGIEKKDFNRPNVEKRFKELLEEFKNDEEKIKKLKFQEAIIQGLMAELDKMVAQQMPQNIKELTVKIDDVKLMKKKFKITKTNYSIEDIDKGFNLLAEKARAEKNAEELSKLAFEANVLLAFIEEQKRLSEAKKEESKEKPKPKKASTKKPATKEKEYIVTDENNKIKKKIKVNTSGEIDEVEDSERAQSKTKIG